MKKTTKLLTMLSALILAFCIPATGCSTASTPLENSDNSAQKDQETNQTKYITEMEFADDDSFWEFAESEYKVSSFQDISEGKHSGEIVIVDAIILGGGQSSGTTYKYTVAYKMEDGTFQCFEESVTPSFCKLMTNKDSLLQLKQGDTVRLCAMIQHSTDIDFNVVYGLKVTGKDNESVNKILNNNDNPLMNSYIYYDNVMSGDKSKIIGHRAYIEYTKSDIKEITPEQYIEFATSKVQDSGHNWFTIFLGDGTAINFEGCYIYLASYGKCDADGTILEPYGNIEISLDGSSVEYLPCENEK